MLLTEKAGGGRGALAGMYWNLKTSEVPGSRVLLCCSGSKCSPNTKLGRNIISSQTDKDLCMCGKKGSWVEAGGRGCLFL